MTTIITICWWTHIILRLIMVTVPFIPLLRKLSDEGFRLSMGVTVFSIIFSKLFYDLWYWSVNPPEFVIFGEAIKEIYSLGNYFKILVSSWPIFLLSLNQIINPRFHYIIRISGRSTTK